MNHIKEKIKELASKSLGNITSISYGYKFVNGVQTNDLAIIYGVAKKKSLSELSADEIIPTTITAGIETLKTDVFESPMPELLLCNAFCGQVAGPNSAANRTLTRPLVGGLSISSTNTVFSVGTFGFIAVHDETNALVGVTNNHVIIQDAFLTSERNLMSLIRNEYSPVNTIYQDGENGFIPPANYNIGQSLRYVPVSGVTDNRVDCAIFSLQKSDIEQSIISKSVMQSGDTYSNPLPFATSSEIDNLLTTNPMIYSSGRTTGPKGGALCPIRIFSIFTAFPILYAKQGGFSPVVFTDQITYVKTDPATDPALSPTCPNPVYSGDSGSALIADFGGVRKIVGHVFAGTKVGSDFIFGYANRIDNTAIEMGIKAWDGTHNVKYIDPTSIDYITTPNGSSNKYIDCNAKKYWQVGLTNSNNPCGY